MTPTSIAGREDEGEHPRECSVHGSHLLARCHSLRHVINPNVVARNHFPVTNVARVH